MNCRSIFLKIIDCSMIFMKIDRNLYILSCKRRASTISGIGSRFRSRDFVAVASWESWQEILLVFQTELQHIGAVLCEMWCRMNLTVTAKPPAVPRLRSIFQSSSAYRIGLSTNLYIGQTPATFTMSMAHSKLFEVIRQYILISCLLFKLM